MTPAFSLLFFLTLPGLYASAQTITLFGVSAPPPSATFVEEASVTFSAGGTNSAGDTTFVGVIAITSEVVLEPDTTITQISVPTTITETFVTAHLVSSEGCFLDDSTATGSVVPIFTLTAPASQATQSGASSQGAPSQTAAQSASPTGGATIHRAFTVWNVLAIAAVALVHALY
ncbi:hypothetical protein MSAN_01983200 [Mycena sanguinolenta]|uniref:Uncharacterized protein n=1 Tax=Mycena sanguinolenta TaxID=230812 RepID=A0A8H6XNI7_9AGAR|nr:hypothetical protein MSAN_01983200 [Mycena sanguinolenta]